MNEEMKMEEIMVFGFCQVLMRCGNSVRVKKMKSPIRSQMKMGLCFVS